MKLFKYIFKHKLLSLITIFLLTFQSMTMLVVPFVGSLSIKYGVEYNGVVFTPLEKIESKYHEIIGQILDSDSVDVYNSSYSKSNEIDDSNSYYYVLNDYAYENMDKLEAIVDPLYAYFNKDKVWQTIGESIIDGNINLTENDIQEIKNDYHNFLENNKEKNYYEDAVLIIANNQQILGLNLRNNQNEIIELTSIILVAIIIIYIVFTIIINLTSSRIVFKNSYYFRKKIYKKVLDFTGSDFQKFSKSTLITRCTNDVQNIQNATIFIIKFVLLAPLYIFVAIAGSYLTAPSLAWVIWVIFGLIILFSLGIMAITSNQFNHIQNFIDKINVVIKEFVGGLFTIRAYNKEHAQLNKFNKININLYKKMVFANSVLEINSPMLALLLNIFCVFCIWFGKDPIIFGYLNIGSLIAFMFFTVTATMSFVSVASAIILFPRANVSIKRIEEIINYKPVVQYKNKDTFSDKNESEYCLEFKNISYKYDNTDFYVIKDSDLRIKKNTTNIIVGSTGCGKSTLIKLMLRYLEPTKGNIYINGKDIKNYSKEDIYLFVSYVPQKTTIFSGSIKENIDLAHNDFSDKEIIHALKNSELSTFINQHNNDINFELSFDGVNVSGGQKQRMVIARALLKNSEIFLFDDPFSSVDFKTEQTLINNMRKKYSDKTIIYSTQRLQNISSKDNIIFIDKNAKISYGPHEVLIVKNSGYKELFNCKE